MAERHHSELLRRLRLMSLGKDRPVTLPYPVFLELLLTAVENLIDEAWYIERYPDVVEGIKLGHFRSAAHHFAASGLQEGRMPWPVKLDEKDYLARHKDVAKAVEAGKLASATEHFYLTGFFEGRPFQRLAETDTGAPPRA